MTVGFLDSECNVGEIISGETTEVLNCSSVDRYLEDEITDCAEILSTVGECIVENDMCDSE